jgi:dynein heavy chain
MMGIVYTSEGQRLQGELAIKNSELATASRDAEKLLHEISKSTAIAEVEKGKVATIVEQVSLTAAVRDTNIRFNVIT